MIWRPAGSRLRCPSAFEKPCLLRIWLTMRYRVPKIRVNIALSYCNILHCRVYNNKNFLRQSLHAQYNGMERIGDHAWRDRSRVQRDVRFCCCCNLFRNFFLYLLTCLPRFYWTKFKYNPYNGIFVIMCKDIWNESSFEMQAKFL